MMPPRSFWQRPAILAVFLVSHGLYRPFFAFGRNSRPCVGWRRHLPSPPHVLRSACQRSRVDSSHSFHGWTLGRWHVWRRHYTQHIYTPWRFSMGMTSAEKMRLKRARDRGESKPSVTHLQKLRQLYVTDSKGKNFRPYPSPPSPQLVENEGEIPNLSKEARARALGKDAKFASPCVEDSAKVPVSGLGGAVQIEGLPHPRPWGWDVPIDLSTGEILPPKVDLVALRLERYALQSAVRRIFPGSRTANCLRTFPNASGVAPSMPEVWKSKEHGTAKYRRLMVCSSVWQCPCCASAISEVRRPELLRAIELHRQVGGDVLLLTLTTPHTQQDNLKALLAGQAAALRQHFFSGKSIKPLYESLGYIGGIRALEVTHGRQRQKNNGWHPHYHLLLFVASGLDIEQTRMAFYKRWLAACQYAGLGAPSFEHGLTLQDGHQAAAYATKWGLESEMVKGHIKKGRKGGETPFDLLRAYLHDGDRQAAALFKEFADAFKGKRQLFWSPGLKAHFSIGEVSDEEAANSAEDSADLLGFIEFEDWRNILKYDIRGEVLEMARVSWPSVQELLKSLRNPPSNQT